LLASAFLFAAEPEAAGVVISASGDVHVVNDEGEKAALNRRSKVFEKQTIVTNPNSKAKVRFTDGGVVSIAPDSIFEINEYSYDADDTDDNVYSVKLIKGSMLSVSGAIVKGNPDAYKVETSVGTIGIAGTLFMVTVSESDEGPKLNVVKIKEETDHKGPPIVTELANGKMIEIEDDQSLEASFENCDDEGYCEIKITVRDVDDDEIDELMLRLGIIPLREQDQGSVASGQGDDAKEEGEDTEEEAAEEEQASEEESSEASESEESSSAESEESSSSSEETSSSDDSSSESLDVEIVIEGDSDAVTTIDQTATDNINESTSAETSAQEGVACQGQ